MQKIILGRRCINFFWFFTGLVNHENQTIEIDIHDRLHCDRDTQKIDELYNHPNFAGNYRDKEDANRNLLAVKIESFNKWYTVTNSKHIFAYNNFA